MHKSFYASGFLYHSPSRQILLQQLTRGNETNFVLFRGKSKRGQMPQEVFHTCIEHALEITIPSSSIHPVYDYIHTQFGEHFIFYVDVKKIGDQTGWLFLSKLSKYPMSEQTRHDITIGERVIRSLIKPPPSPPRYRRN